MVAAAPEFAEKGGFIVEGCAEAVSVGPDTHPWSVFDVSVADSKTARSCGSFLGTCHSVGRPPELGEIRWARSMGVDVGMVSCGQSFGLFPMMHQ